MFFTEILNVWGLTITPTGYDNICLLLAAGDWFSLCTSVFSSNKSDFPDKTEILLQCGVDNH